MILKVRWKWALVGDGACFFVGVEYIDIGVIMVKLFRRFWLV